LIPRRGLGTTIRIPYTFPRVCEKKALERKSRSYLKRNYLCICIIPIIK
jgi:hypothetical protein